MPDTSGSAPPIRTARLDIVSMSPAFLDASLVGDRDRAEALLGCSIADEWLDGSAPVAHWLETLRAQPNKQIWLARAIILRSERKMVGHIGFHTPPGPEYLNEISPGAGEMGYT